MGSHVIPVSPNVKLFCFFITCDWKTEQRKIPGPRNQRQHTVLPVSRKFQFCSTVCVKFSNVLHCHLIALPPLSKKKKCLIFQVLSASSDGTIKLWSLGQQKCIGTIRVHNEGVWTLAALQDGSTFTTVYSAGRDGRVMCTDFRDARFNSYLVCQENAPVLKVTCDYHRKIWKFLCSEQADCACCVVLHYCFFV